MFLNSHGKKHPDLFQRTEVDEQFHPRLGVKAEFNRTRVHDLADGNALRENAAKATGDDVLAGLQIGVAGKITESTKELSSGPPGLMMPRSCAGFSTTPDTLQFGSLIKATCACV